MPAVPTEADARRVRARRVLGPALTVVLTCVALPINLMAMFWLSISLHDYDTSGQGGPFRSCTADSTECSGMKPVGIVLSSAVLVGIAVVIGLAGQATAAFPSKLIGRITLAALSAVVTMVGLALVWLPVTWPRF
ncbi:hypothetical protein GCM10023152_12940 [Agromyces bauzanensis]|uniref:Uncharacterized protein n=1 Tax=Agromyces bauzanensis TaxID=1308924 RepID=A0A917PVY6_9MICO|nr:hypothetical protein GCM10011372_35710 [Agromyces bauzanensis]